MRILTATMPGLLLFAGLLLATRSWPLAAALTAALALPLLLAGWWRTRAFLRRYYSEPLEWAWAATGAAEVDANLDGELRGLKYAPAGVLAERGPHGEVLTPVYLHEALPVYALLVQVTRGGRGEWYCRLESFFEGGGVLRTCPYELPTMAALPAQEGAPRLAQARWWGSATALDGQHVGTVRAWMAGRRQPLPATRGALIGYLEADRRHTRRALEARGWISLSDYARWLVGLPRGVLRF